MVPLFGLLLGEAVAHVRPLQIYVARARGDAVQDGVGYQLALDAQVPLVRFQLRGYERGAEALSRLTFKLTSPGDRRPHRAQLLRDPHRGRRVDAHAHERHRLGAR